MSGFQKCETPHTDPPRWQGKATTLEWLRPQIHTSHIPIGVSFDLKHWHEQPEAVLKLIESRISSRTLIVRSDRCDEDTPIASNAGRYRSCLDIRRGEREALAEAIDNVFASYHGVRGADRVLVQQQIEPVRHASVALTHALPDGAHYYVISIARGPRSDGVTCGADNVETWYLARDNPRRELLPETSRGYFDALREIESLTGASPCEVELATDKSGTIWLLQARPLVVRSCDGRATIALRKKVEAELAALSHAPPLLGMMPDWNPAELIGEHPRPLARELFSNLLMRRSWRIARHRLGYAPVEAAPLMQIHAGRPYIDARLSIQSLFPAGISPGVQARLLDACSNRLREKPELHDKLEFGIVFSTLVPGLESAIEARYPGVLDAEERRAFAALLHAPTLAALDRTRAQRLLDLFTRDLCNAPQKSESNIADFRRSLKRLELRTGIHFAMAARMAFVAEALLRSMSDAGVLSANRMTEFKHAALSTASLPWLQSGLSGTEDRFGHVRAGTFEIGVPMRKEIGIHDNAGTRPTQTSNSSATFLTEEEKRGIRSALAEIDIPMTAEELIAHYQTLIQLRELGKFALARGVSALLDTLTSIAKPLGIDRDDAGWLGLDELLSGCADTGEPQIAVAAARAHHALENQLRMPLLIRDAQLDVIHHPPGHPNYLGNGRISGQPIHIDARSHPDHLPLHAIVAIASADPGFDWIFLRRPAALVTSFGGPNSHMAIRCAENAVPALLGVGPEAFRRLVSAPRLTIDFDMRIWTNIDGSNDGSNSAA